MTKTIALSAVADLAPLLAAGELVALDVGPDSLVYAAVALTEPDDRRTADSGASFPKVVPDRPQSYRVAAFRDGEMVVHTRIVEQPFNLHFVQPLPGGELLLACARSSRRAPDDYDLNGRVYSADGRLLREFLLGDGIARLQTTSAGDIWTSYFDEGVFGNLGWEDPVGAPGLIAWDAQGRAIYRYEPADGLDHICDCYALNVAADSETWLYYYTEFPLVRLSERRIAAHWQLPVAGSTALAVDDNLTMLSGSYDDRTKQHLLELGAGGDVRERAQLTLTDADGEPLQRAFGRGDALYFVSSAKVYCCTISQAVLEST